MVIADWLRAKYVTPLKEQREAERERQRAEVRAEVNRVWREWNRRRKEAEDLGEPFGRAGTLWRRRVAFYSNCCHTQYAAGNSQ